MRHSLTRLSQINYTSKRFPVDLIFFLYYASIVLKTKGQQPLVAKLELLALCDFRGGLAEWSSAADCKSVNGGLTTVLGFESLTRRPNSNYTPATALTSTGARTAQPTPYESDSFSIRLLAVELQ